jgi:hypothetical protein
VLASFCGARGNKLWIYNNKIIRLNQSDGQHVVQMASDKNSARMDDPPIKPPVCEYVKRNEGIVAVPAKVRTSESAWSSGWAACVLLVQWRAHV